MMIPPLNVLVELRIAASLHRSTCTTMGRMQNRQTQKKCFNGRSLPLLKVSQLESNRLCGGTRSIGLQARQWWVTTVTHAVPFFLASESEEIL